MSSPPTTTTASPDRVHRPSKFIEGSPLTGPDLQQQTRTSNELFFSILSEMDEFERKRKHHRNSHSSTDSSLSSGSPKESRTSLGGLGRPSMDVIRETLNGDPRGAEKKSRKFVGRLRALTGGRERDGEGKSVPYTRT